MDTERTRVLRAGLCNKTHHFAGRCALPHTHCLIEHEFKLAGRAPYKVKQQDRTRSAIAEPSLPPED